MNFSFALYYGRVLRLRQMYTDGLHDAIQIIQNIAVPETHRFKTFCLQPL